MFILVIRPNKFNIYYYYYYYYMSLLLYETDEFLANDPYSKPIITCTTKQFILRLCKFNIF